MSATASGRTSVSHDRIGRVAQLIYDSDGLAPALPDAIESAQERARAARPGDYEPFRQARCLFTATQTVLGMHAALDLVRKAPLPTLKGESFPGEAPTSLPLLGPAIDDFREVLDIPVREGTTTLASWFVTPTEHLLAAAKADNAHPQRGIPRLLDDSYAIYRSEWLRLKREWVEAESSTRTPTAFQIPA